MKKRSSSAGIKALKIGMTIAALASFTQSAMAEQRVLPGRDVNITERLVNERTVIRDTRLYVYIGERDELHIKGESPRIPDRGYQTHYDDGVLRRQVRELAPSPERIDIKPPRPGVVLTGSQMKSAMQKAPKGSLNGYFVELDRSVGTDKVTIQEDVHKLLKQTSGIRKGNFLNEIAQELPPGTSNADLRMVAEKIPKGMTLKDVMAKLPKGASILKVMKNVAKGAAISVIVAAGANAEEVQKPTEQSGAGLNTKSVGRNSWAAPTTAGGAQ